MRLFLESSKKKYLNLEDELTLLGLYMELEQPPILYIRVPKTAGIWLGILVVNLIFIYATTKLENFVLLTPEVLLYNSLSLLIMFGTIIFLFWKAQNELLNQLRDQKTILKNKKFAELKLKALQSQSGFSFSNETSLCIPSLMLQLIAFV